MLAAQAIEGNDALVTLDPTFADAAVRLAL